MFSNHGQVKREIPAVKHPCIYKLSVLNKQRISRTAHDLTFCNGVKKVRPETSGLNQMPSNNLN